MRPRHAVMLALLSAVWGASYLLIAEAIETMPEGLVVLGRTGLAALALLVLIRVRGGDALALLADVRRRPGTALMLGLFAIGLPFTLITFGERTVPSGLSAVLIASTPIFVGILAPFLDRSEIMSPLQWGGLVVGLVGVGLLVGVEQIGTVGEFLGAMAMIGAAASYALSGFILKGRYAGFPPLVTTFISVAAAAVIAVPLAAAQPPDRAPSATAVLCVVVLALVGTAWAFVAYFRLIGEIGYGRASVVAYTIPPVALAYGRLVRHEPVTVAAIGAMALILIGVFLVASRLDRRGGRYPRVADSRAIATPPPGGPR